MPGFDRTGPSGKGSGTGRKSGKCYSDRRHKDDDVTFGAGVRERKRNFRDKPGSGFGLGRGRS